MINEEKEDICKLALECKVSRIEADYMAYKQLLTSYLQKAEYVQLAFNDWCSEHCLCIEQWDKPVSMPENLRAFFDNFPADNLASSYYMTLTAQVAYVLNGLNIDQTEVCARAKYLQAVLSAQFNEIIWSRIKSRLDKLKEKGCTD